ncbi:uncharacterized protein WCC33_002682 [Rhinophrynus dorsalis]
MAHLEFTVETGGRLLPTQAHQPPRVGGLTPQKKHRRKGSGSSDENTSTRRVKLQTSFPPIHLSLSSNSKPLDKNHRDHASNLDISRDIRGEKINLPQVENASENVPKSVKSFPEKFKYTKDYGCNMNSLSSTPAFPCDGQKDAKVVRQPWLDVPVAKSSSDRLSPESSKHPECPSCKNERRIRSDYDKLILQSKKEKEFLQQKINLLESELKKYIDINKLSKKSQEDASNSLESQNEADSHLGNLQNIYKNKCSSVISMEEYRKLEAKNKEKQEQIDTTLIKIEEIKAQLDKVQDGEREQEKLFKSKQNKLVFEMEDLKFQLERTRDREKMEVSSLENEKYLNDVELTAKCVKHKEFSEKVEHVLKQLENTKTEMEKFKKRRSLLIAELCKEKDCCLMEIEKLKEYTEKIKAENTSLSETVQRLQKELEKGSRCSCLARQLYPSAAEVLLISHSDSPENGHTVGTDYKYRELCSCGRVIQNLSLSSNKSLLTHVEEDEVKVKELYKQIKRERNLLLDVMVIMYTRRWFVEEAVPHVKRALRKCGAFSGDTD